ncbi:hypothetical protein A3863_24375 [Priestia endophytica]|uniref:polysaccharide pyruvyl transferase family protein n=1 Tax=Priestia endophytica TaxID=135735 RepID=UPI000DCA8BEC|nr:polysaccharide pyruvyl transferase family protein [Priestia endophytica]RAS84340.1 hypothetical protein A3863_24375 [Priestia endophytica]
MKKILLRGYYGYKNSGDDALFYAIVEKMNRMSKVHFNVLSKDELYYPKENSGNLIFNYPSLKNILSGIISSDILIFGGGSQLQDYGKIRLQLSLLKTYMIVSLTKLLKKDVIYLGVSIGPLETRLGKIIGKKILSKSNYIVVRDQSSYNHLKKMNLKDEDIKLAPDLAISLIDIIPVKHISKDNKKLVIGVNLLPFFSAIKGDKEKELELIENISTSINIVSKEYPNVEIRFFSFQEDEEINDYHLLNLLEKMVDIEIKMRRYQSNPLSLMEELSECDRFIGMRLHSTIFAYANDIPQLILSYHPKCKGFANLVGYQPENVVDVFNMKGEEFTNKLRNLIKKPDYFKPSSSVFETKKEIDKVYEKISDKFLKDKNGRNL